MTKEHYLYMEDVSIGQKYIAGPHEMTADEIIRYAREFDPQDFHTNPEAARHTVFGELVASGWHTASVTMSLILKAVPKMKGGMIGRAVENMNWPRPVRPGDFLSVTCEIQTITPSKTNPNRGTIRVYTRTVNQRGETVMEMTTVIMIPRRTAG